MLDNLPFYPGPLRKLAIVCLLYLDSYKDPDKLNWEILT